MLVCERLREATAKKPIQHIFSYLYCTYYPAELYSSAYPLWKWYTYLREDNLALGQMQVNISSGMVEDLPGAMLL